MSTLRRHPVSRGKVLVGALVAVAVIAAIVALSEWLRPARDFPAVPITPELDADPRLAVDCPEPHAREGAREQAPRTVRPVHVSSTDLYDCPTTWDGRAVRFTGEVVGAVLRRGDHAWLQLNDDVYAGGTGPLPFHREYRGGNSGVGVLVPVESIDAVRHVGGPAVRGDRVEVAGVFGRVDPQTREVGIVRADSLKIVAVGGALPRAVEPTRVLVAALFALVAGGLLVLERVLRRRR